MRRTIMFSGIVAAVFCLLCSCEHKKLCFDHTHVVDMEIKFDWTDMPDADPNTMVVHVFRMDGSHYSRHEFGSPEGGKIRIEAGEYKLLFHNGEMENVSEKGGSYDSYELTTLSQSLLAPMGRGELSAPPRPSEAGEQPVRSVPETVWGGQCEYMEVQSGVSGQSVTLRPSEMTVEYTVEVRDVKNMSDALVLSAALTGMSESWRVAGGVSSGVPVTMPLELLRPDDHTLVARFASFGHCPQEPGEHIFSIYTSNKKYFDFNVTDQMHGASDPKHVYIVIVDEVVLPVPEEGMNPSISDWDDVVNNDIPMN